MRIDFLGTYRQVAKLVNASAEAQEPSAQPQDFAATLSSLTGQRAGKTTASVSTAPVEPASARDLMASLRIEQPQIKPPPLSAFETTLLPPDPVKEEGNSVKTPSVLGVNRLNVQTSKALDQRMEKVATLVSSEGKETGIDPALGMAVAQAESSFNPKAISSDGHQSKGLFQLLDSTGKELHAQSGSEVAYNPFNPDQNVALGLRYLRRLHDTFSQSTKLPNKLESFSAANSSSLEKLAVAAFNAGEGRVASAQTRARAAGMNPGVYEEVQPYLPKSTQEYVNRVMQLKGKFGTDDVG